MITDAQLRFSSAQAITTGAVNSTNVVDLTTADDIARGLPMRAKATVGTTFTSGGAGTLQAQLVTSTAAALTSPTVLFDTGAVALGTLVAGYDLFDIVVPKTAKRYIGIVYTEGTADMTAGTVNAGLVVDTESAQAARIVGNTALS